MNFSRKELYETTKILNQCAQARTEDDVLDVINQSHAVVPFETAVVIAFQQCCDDRNVKINIINHSYNSQWLDIYRNRDYIAIDPVMNRAKSTNMPFFWSDVFSSIRSNKDCSVHRRLSDFFCELHRYNLLDGIAGGCQTDSSSDVQIVALFSLSRFAERRYLEFLRLLLPVLRIAVQEALLSRKHARRRESLLNTLTTREREVLRWACIGKTSWEIGRILSITERTVKFHLNNTFNKLEVANRPQAIAKAVGLGLV